MWAAQVVALGGEAGLAATFTSAYSIGNCLGRLASGCGPPALKYTRLRHVGPQSALDVACQFTPGLLGAVVEYGDAKLLTCAPQSTRLAVKR